MPIQRLVRRRCGQLLVALASLCAAGAVPAVAARPASTVAPPTARNASGKVTFVGPASFTIQTGGRKMGTINALTASANALAVKNYPYVWGGGHGAAGFASVGVAGPGHNGRRTGYDCSGAVAAALAGAGLWPAGAAVPNDAGVISALLSRRLIAPGAGTAPDEVTLYDHPGIHIFININGRFWGTSDGSGGGDANGGPGWLSDGAWDANSKQFKRYHVLPWVLRDSTSYGQDYTFQFLRNPLLAAGLLPGDAVRVAYAASGIGTMNAMAVSYTGERLGTGTVEEIGLGGSSFTLVSGSGKATSYQTGGNFTLAQEISLGDVASVAYTTTRASRGAPLVTMAHSVQVNAAAAAGQATGTVVAIAAGGDSFTLQPATGPSQSFLTGAGSRLLNGVQVGEPVVVNFVQATGGLPIAEQVLMAPPPQPPPTTTTPTGTTTTGTPTGTSPAGTTPPSTTPTGA